MPQNGVLLLYILHYGSFLHSSYSFKMYATPKLRKNSKKEKKPKLFLSIP